MVCSHCGSIGHNKRTCLKSSEATPSEKRAAKALASLLPPPNKAKKVSKPLEGLIGCQNIWKEPKEFYTKKKVPKTLEGLSGCQNIWKEPKEFYTKKKAPKTLEGLSGCQNIWKEPKELYTKKKAHKTLEGLSGCQNIWKEPKEFYTKKKVNRKQLTLGGKCDFQLIPLDAEALKEASEMIQLSPPRPRPTKSQ